MDNFFKWAKESYPPKPQAENKPDWEVMEYSHKAGGKHYLNGDCGCPISSVKRLSDDEILSVDEYTADGKIKSFEIDKGGICMVWLYPTEGYDKYLWLNTVEKLLPKPQKLLTTEDGVDKISGKEPYTQQQVDSMCEEAFSEGWIARDRGINRLLKSDLDIYKKSKQQD